MFISQPSSLRRDPAAGLATFLVGDVGGTNCRLALAQRASGDVILTNPQSYKCADFPTAEAIIDIYLKTLGWSAPLGAAVIAIAGKQMVKGDLFDYFGEANKTREQLEAAGFRVWTPPHPKGELLADGDTATFLSLLDNGLEGWRQENRRNPAVYQTAGTTNIVTFGGAPPGGGAPRAPVGQRPPSRYFGPLMNELAERMTWAVTPKYADANHYPIVVLKSAKVSGKPGEVVNLSVTTKDPDGDAVSVKWWRFENNGLYAGAGLVTLTKSEGVVASLRIPADAKPGDTIHLIAEATDNGTLPLTRYARAVVTVK